MTPEERRRSALEIIQLRRLFGSDPAPEVPPQFREVRERHLQKIRDLMVDIYAEVFSDEQLQDLLEFYGSEKGKAITKTESVIAERFRQRVKELGAELNAEAAKASNGLLRSISGVKPTPDEGS